MGRIVSKARQVRLDYQQRLGRTVTIQDVATAIDVTRAALSNLERNKTSQIEYETLRKLCEFYGVTVGDLLVYEDRRARRRPWSEGISPRRAGSEAAEIVPAIPTLRPA